MPDLENDHHGLVRIQLVFVVQIYMLIFFAMILGTYHNRTIRHLSAEEVKVALDLNFEGELTTSDDGGKMKYSNDNKGHVLYSRLSGET